MQIDDEILEKVILGQDLSVLKPAQKVQYVNALCKSLKLNPLTKPFEIMKFNGKEIPYARKDCAEQLRKVHNISIDKIDTKMMEGGLYVVTAHAIMPDGRQDSSTGALSIAGLKGEALGNALMKAETKAKRRVTLSICGLGILDESEVDSMPNTRKNMMMNDRKPVEIKMIDTVSDLNIDGILLDISQCADLDDLERIFKDGYKQITAAKDKVALQRLIEAKDKRKSEINLKEFNQEIDAQTGEVING